MNSRSGVHASCEMFLSCTTITLLDLKKYFVKNSLIIIVAQVSVGLTPQHMFPS
jgi:hypothetical protein